MITQIQITGIAYEVDEVTRKYVLNKIGQIDRYLPKHAGKVIIAKDSTGNMLAAIDIVEVKLQSQLRDYKQATIAHIGRRGIMSRFKRSFKREL
jgi:putative sigma-54 modulation protein